MRYRWVAIDTNGGWIPEIAEGRQQNVDKLVGKQLSQFILVDEQNGHVVTQYFDEGHRLVCYKQPKAHVLGWRQTVHGRNVQHHAHCRDNGCVETGDATATSLIGRYQRLLQEIPSKHLGVFGTDPARIEAISNLAGVSRPKPEYTWVAIYKDGQVFTQKNPQNGKSRSIAEVSVPKLSAFALLNRQKKVVLVQYMSPGQRLIYRRRTALTQNARTTAASCVSCHLVGWQQDIAGRNVQHVAYCFEDGRIQMAGNFRDHDQWMRSIQPHPYEFSAVD